MGRTGKPSAPSASGSVGGTLGEAVESAAASRSDHDQQFVFGECAGNVRQEIRYGGRRTLVPDGEDGRREHRAECDRTCERIYDALAAPCQTVEDEAMALE